MASGDYTKTTWVATVTALSAARLNNLETQFEEAAYIPGARLIPPVVRWTCPGWHWDANVNQVVVANRIYYTPIYIPESTTYDRIGIYVSVGDGAGGLADLRIFNWDTGVPGSLVLSAGTVSTNAGGAKEIIINQTLNGLYFLAVRVDQAPQLAGPGLGRVIRSPVTGIAITNSQLGPRESVLYDDAAYANPAGTVDGITTANYAFVRLREA